jgi:hypothetical protein
MGNRINRDYDRRTGRPLTDGRDIISVLTNEELEAEVTIAAAEPKLRAQRLDALLLELSRRRARRSLRPI